MIEYFLLKIKKMNFNLKVIGAFSNEILRNESEQYYGSNDTLVFVLEPEEINYPSKLKNKCFIHSNLEYFSFGGGEY